MSCTRPLALAVAMVAGAGCQRAPQFDLIVRGGDVVDGTGAAVRRADVGVKGDRVAEIGDLSGRTAGREVAAQGRMVAPGFIDTQGQSGATLLIDGNGESHVRQGITTEIIGEGDSPGLWTSETADRDIDDPEVRVDWKGFDGYLQRLEARGTSINLGSFTSINRLRGDLIGVENRRATPDEMATLEARLEDTMKCGSFGLASALIYPPASFATTDELVALARVAARHGGLYISHVRGESFRLKEALAEAIEIGRQAGLPVVIYHVKVAARQHWGTMGEVARLIEEARASGVNVSATQYPYTAGGTSLEACLPGWAQEGGREAMVTRLKDPAVRAKVRHEVETTIDGWENLIAASTFDGIQIASVPPETDQAVLGKRIGQLAAERGRDPWDVFFDLLLSTGGRVGALFHMMSEDDVKTAMALPWVSVGTDSAALRPDGPLGRGQPHPRAYGTFPRILGRYVRTDRVIDLPLAIHKMTGFAAGQMQLHDRGILRAGAFADLVVFDPATVSDVATFEHPQQFPTGIETVIVNGVVTVDEGRHTGAHAGRALFGPGYKPAGPS